MFEAEDVRYALLGGAPATRPQGREPLLESGPALGGSLAWAVHRTDGGLVHRFVVLVGFGVLID